MLTLPPPSPPSQGGRRGRRRAGAGLGRASRRRRAKSQEKPRCTLAFGLAHLGFPWLSAPEKAKESQRKPRKAKRRARKRKTAAPREAAALSSDRVARGKRRVLARLLRDLRLLAAREAPEHVAAAHHVALLVELDRAHDGIEGLAAAQHRRHLGHV